MIDIADDDIVFLKESHTYLVGKRKVASVTQVIDAAGLGPNFSLVPPHVLKMAQDRGNAVHVACAYIDAGELDWKTVDPRIEGYVRAYESFRKQKVVKTIAVEQRMAAQIDPENKWLAGTPDLIGFIDGRRAIVDLKTGQNASAGLQTAGYQMLWTNTYPTKPIYDRYALRLKKDGRYKLVPEQDPDDGPAFLDALEYATAKKKMEHWNGKYGM